jgi:hypothetical protein
MSEHIEDDYTHIRDELYSLTTQGREAIELMLEVARESEHPRAFEVLGQLIKQNADISEKIMKLQKSKKEVDNVTDNTPPALGGPDVVNNNVFIGSTAELQKMLRDEIVIEDAENIHRV